MSTMAQPAPWFLYAIAAAVLYGAHQIFTRLAAEGIGEGIGSLVVESSAAATILLYLAVLWAGGRWDQKITAEGLAYSLLTGLCVGGGTIVFFLMFQRGGPLSAVPAILAGGAALMAVAGVVAFHEPITIQRMAGVVMAIAGLLLLRS